MNKGTFNLLKNYKGYAFARLVTQTEPELRKTGRETGRLIPWKKVTKFSRQVVGVGYEYSKSVNNELTKEGKASNFVARELPWGEWLDGSKTIITHKGKNYVRVTFNANNPPHTEYKDEKGRLIEYAELKEFLPVKGESRQGTDNPIRVATYSLDSILEFRFNGIRYRNTIYGMQQFLKSLVGAGA